MVGVVLVCTLPLDVVLIVHVLGALLGVAVGFELVVLVHSCGRSVISRHSSSRWNEVLLTVGLCKLVDLSTDKAGEKFLGKGVVDDIACEFILVSQGHVVYRCGTNLTLFTLVVLIQLEAFEGGSAGDQLMAELALVVRVVVAAILAVDLLVGVLCFVCVWCQP